ncbi:MAG TPA: cyclopropane-fatty-acyl-phospholipid synthase family protein, partial [Opitutus sp.]|nr:cyclopropane-fatty-acyl-phospholipid synthase family protein [Opitutus sp.]
VAFLGALFADLPLARVGFRLWDGSAWPDAKPRAATLVLRGPGSLPAMFARGTAMGLAEAYLRDEFDVEGDIEAAVDLAVALERRPTNWASRLSAFYRLKRLPGNARARDGRWFDGARGERHSLARDREAVSFHYDVSNEFYRLWLDERMVYSCAYFASVDDSIDAAQTAKLDYLCRKLRLKPGQQVLDIGCGWGGLAVFAAKTFGVRVTGVTLSEQQAAWATAQVRVNGLADRVAIERRDYRELAAAKKFDAIVSVGMAEHVGRERLPEYFGKAWELLRPGGVFLNHAIGEGRTATRFRGPSFVDAYVFPDADIVPLPLVLEAAGGAGFEVRDVENLRGHYTLTLRCWVRRLEAAHERARAFVNEPAYRVWRLYLAGSAHGFACGDLAIFQTLLAKPEADGRAGVPLRREDWYR